VLRVSFSALTLGWVTGTVYSPLKTILLVYKDYFLEQVT